MENKTFLLPGDVVKLNKKLDYTPKMMVVKKVTKSLKDKPDFLQGFLCMWFTTEYELQTGIFSSKDLIKLD